MTPTVRAPPSLLARATAPIMATLAPPQTSDQPRAAIPVPTSAARSRYLAGTDSCEAQ